ncbi:putative ankyrin repeat protein RF_0381 [Microplitis demolitor]|uniref:putative ankyrin repeat protein RF_0381 n=1 Tax=Microplitis demolitor TaxID=69319 RepID=UPI0004CD5F54|nr:putative ankyrin repeat protein RF_0381 [Microplitis demolitor]
MESLNYDIVKYLIDNGVDINVALENFDSTTGETALHLAAATGTKEIIKLLLDNNANINAKNIKGITPIIKAVKANNHDAMDALMEYRPDLFCTYDKYRYRATIFHAAISSYNWKFLFDWLFILADTRDDNNNSFFSFFESQLLLHYALSIIRDEDKIIMFLLEVGLDVNALDSNGKLAIE